MQSIKIYRNGKEVSGEVVTHDIKAAYKAAERLGQVLNADEIRIASVRFNW